MGNPYFPFHSLGFKCNPFRAVTDAEWLDIAILPDSLAETLLRGFVHLQLLGGEGHGKTTALLMLADRFRREGRRVVYEHIEIGQTEFVTPLDSLDIFLLDEADRLSAQERQRLLTALSADGRGLRSVLSSHEDLTQRFARSGLPLITLRFDTTTLTHVAAIIRRRLACFALDPDAPGVTVSPDAIACLHQTFGADVRAIEQTLYEVFQRRRERGEVGVEEVRHCVTSGFPLDYARPS
jgi:chromosomal replication initiation ATPase DnaA